jgi:hypothetical protein
VKTISLFIDFIMKKLTLYVLATSLLMWFIPNRINANTANDPAKANEPTTIRAADSNTTASKSAEIKSIEFTAFTSTESREMLNESRPEANEQGRHHGIFHRRAQHRDVDVVVTSDNRDQRDGYIEGRHWNGGAYIGGGSLILLIIILIIVL